MADFEEHPVMTKSATSPNSSSALDDFENDVISSIPLLAGMYLLVSFVPILLQQLALVNTETSLARLEIPSRCL